MTSNQIKVSLVATQPVFYVKLEKFVDEAARFATYAIWDFVVAVEDVVLGGGAIGIGAAATMLGFTVLATSSEAKHARGRCDVKRRLAHQHIIDNGTETPQISSFAIRCLFNDLWSHVD